MELILFVYGFKGIKMQCSGNQQEELILQYLFITGYQFQWRFVASENEYEYFKRSIGHDQRRDKGTFFCEARKF